MESWLSLAHKSCARGAARNGPYGLAAFWPSAGHQMTWSAAGGSYNWKQYKSRDNELNYLLNVLFIPRNVFIYKYMYCIFIWPLSSIMEQGGLYSIGFSVSLCPAID